VIETIEPAFEQQSLVNARFQSEASHWVDIYEEGGRDFATVGRQVVRERHAEALAWIDGLGLPTGSRVLEVGGGAGLMSVALARRGYRVDAVDASQAMVELTRQSAHQAGCEDAISAATGDACALEFVDGAFDLTLAIGVISWLDRPDMAIREMARVTRPGGHVLVTSFNRDQLIGIVDPLRNPLVRPVLHRVKRLAVRVGAVKPSATLSYQSRGAVDGHLASAGLTKRRYKTLGFGPFTLLQRNLFSAPFGMKAHGRLQRLADTGFPGLRSTGMFYLVLADKPRADHVP
jgi:ubiquinone/menaquinone biosynthesis C-methylase UbiE